MKNRGSKKTAVTALIAAGLSAVLLFSGQQSDAAQMPTDALIRGSGPAVYYLASDGKRYVFPDQRVYASWFSDFSDVVQVTDEELAAMPIGGNVTHRPGIRMIKIQSDPKVYAVARGGVLRWVATETVAEELYGPYWNTRIDDVSVAFFTNYAIGAPIEGPADFDPTAEAAAAATIGADKGLSVSADARTSDTAPGNEYEEWREFALRHANDIRAEHGKPPLTRDPLLDRIAFMHSKDMARNIKAMSHDGSRGEDAGDRLYYGKVPDPDNDGFIYLPVPDGIVQAGENVGRRDIDWFGGDPEAAIVDQHEWFMDEPPDEKNHRTTMLSVFFPFNVIGIGLYLDQDNVLWITEDFIVQN